jgi:signal transduction histidine kinase
MNGRTVGRLAWGIAFACFAMAAPSLVLLYLNRAAIDSFNSSNVFGLVAAVTFGVLGGVVASRRPKNPIGWLMLGIAVGNGVSALAWLIALRALLAGASPGSWPRWFAWVHGWIGNLVGGALVLVFLLFPDGKPFNSRWRWVVKLTVIVSIVSTAFSALAPSSTELASHLPSLANPIGVSTVKGFGGPASLASVILILLALVSLVRRLRRSSGDERQQLKLFAYAVCVSLGLVIVAVFLPLISQALSDAVFNGAFFFGFAFATPGAVALAILRYGLYEIDVVISQTIVYGALVAFISVVYIALVVGIGSTVGSAHNPFLTLVAAAVIAMAFNPVRERARRLADHLVYGERATPYEVLSEFSESMAGTYALDEILPRMARVLAEGSGGRAAIWLRVGDVLRSASIWPTGSEPADPPAELSVSDQNVPAFPEVSKAAPVLHHGELLGAITVTKPPNDPLRPAEAKLIEDLAAQAGLVLRNARLNAELMARLEELRASRQRLVKAQDEERRRIERNIHDGAQQQLVALAVKANLAQSIAKRDPEKVEQMLGQLKDEATDALENLRDLARGIYPPLLADKGLTAALGSQAGKSAVPVSLESEGIERYPEEVEAAVYFCCLEALQNIAKYADASAVMIRLSDGSGTLAFEVTDDGRGFDPASTGYGTGVQGMADRLDALGGSLEVRSTPGQGTTVVGRVPILPS